MAIYMWREYNWWQPWANTMWYYPLTSTTSFNDQSWNNRHFTKVWTVNFWTYQWVDCAYFGGWYWTISQFNVGSDTNRTISFYQYTLSNAVWYDTFADASNYWFWKSFKVWIWTNSSWKLRAEIFWSNWDWWATSSSLSYNEQIYTPDRAVYNEWVHCVMTFEVLTSEQAIMKLYLNWQLCYSGTWNRWNKMSTRTWQHVMWSDPYDWIWGRLFYWWLSNLIIENKTRSLSDVEDYFDETKSLYFIN